MPGDPAASAPSLHERFTPDYTPEQLESLGVYDALYRGQGPRLASLGEWKPEWISEHDPKGWAQWYKRYASGRRLEGEDARQIKRWLSFKARHGGPFSKNPTPRRGWALRNWGIDPAKLAPDRAQEINELLDEHQRKAMQKFVKEKVAAALFHGSTQSNLDELRASQPNLGGAGVYGADNLDWAALYALAKDRRGMAVLGGTSPKLLINKANALAPEGYVYEYSSDTATPPPADDPNRGWQVPGNVTPLRKHIVKLVDHMKNIEQFDDKESLRKRWAELNAKSAALSPDLTLQEHQQRVADRISGEDPRLLVYHGLGSGKSLSALAAAEAAKKVSGGEYGVVVPASLRGNFQKEIKKFTRNSKPEILSYTGLALGKRPAKPLDTVVMDEAQRLRNPGADSTQGAQELARQAKRLVLLSGTPITNSPSDLASLISLLDNQQISPQDFEKRYIGYKKKFPGVLNWLRGAQWGEEPYVKNEEELRTRLKGKVDYQPSKTPQGVTVNEELVKVPLSAEQSRIQKAIRTKIPPGFLWKLDQEFPLSRDELNKLNSFLTGLRQVSLSTQPFRADKDPLKAFDQSAKLREALKRLRENLDADPRKKAIIYSNFIDSGIQPYAKALERDKIPYGIFHGGIPVKDRQKALQDYNEGKLRALLLGPAAAEGISTKGTSLIQLLDPYWHESRTQQARGRGLRFDSHDGLPEELKNVAVQRFLSSSEEPGIFGKLLGKTRQRTGDEVLQHLSENKEKLNEEFRKILREVGAEKHKGAPAE